MRMKNVKNIYNNFLSFLNNIFEIKGTREGENLRYLLFFRSVCIFKNIFTNKVIIIEQKENFFII